MYLIMVRALIIHVYPFVVFFPFAGDCRALLAFSFETISIFSILGIIMMIGLVAKNARLWCELHRQTEIRRIGVKSLG